MAYLSKTRQLIAKEEVTNGTYNAPIGADFDVITKTLADVAWDDGHDNGVDQADGTFIMSKSESGQKSGSVQFACDMKWSGDALTAPKWWNRYLKFCGFSITTGATPAVAEYDGTPTCKTTSLLIPYWQCDGTGTADRLAGAYGAVEIGADAVGATIRPSFTFTGKNAGGVSLASGEKLTPVGVDTTDCEKWIGSTFTLGGYAYKVWSWNLSIQGDVQMLVDPSDDTGIAYAHMVGANPQLSMTVTREPIATVDPRSDVMSDTVYSGVTFGLKHFDIECTSAQLTEVTNSVNNESATYDFTVKVDKVKLTQKS